MNYSLCCETCLTEGESISLVEAQRIAREHLADHPGHRIHVHGEGMAIGITVHDCFVREEKIVGDG